MLTLQKIHSKNFFSSASKFLKFEMSSKCTIAVCQMTSTNDKKRNLETVKRLVTEASHKNAKVFLNKLITGVHIAAEARPKTGVAIVNMVFLPEACDYLGKSIEEINALGEALDGPLMTEYSELAKKCNVWLSIGGFHEVVVHNDDIKMNNCHVILNDKGEIVSVYKKLHLFNVSIPERNVNLRESDNVIAGDQIVSPVETPAGPVGLSICYDLRFPELSVLLRKKGASILTFPSAFTNLTGKAHWEILLRSRAIENQCYVVAAAQYGVHNEKRISFGQTMVVNPWGEILVECMKYSEDTPTNECFVTAEIDSEALLKIRSEMPVFEHRRNDMYKLLELKGHLEQPDIQETYNFADKIIKSSTVFLCTKYSFAFTNIRCVVTGHVLVSSRRVARRLEDLTQEEISDLFQCVVKIQQVLGKVYGSGSSTICIQDGKFAGQTIPHVHVHILPRKQGDFDRNDDVYQNLANHDRDENSPIRSLEEMIKEATLLRGYFYS